MASKFSGGHGEQYGGDVINGIIISSRLVFSSSMDWYLKFGFFSSRDLGFLRNLVLRLCEHL